MLIVMTLYESIICEDNILFYYIQRIRDNGSLLLLVIITACACFSIYFIFYSIPYFILKLVSVFKSKKCDIKLL